MRARESLRRNCVREIATAFADVLESGGSLYIYEVYVLRFVRAVPPSFCLTPFASSTEQPSVADVSFCCWAFICYVCPPHSITS